MLKPQKTEGLKVMSTRTAVSMRSRAQTEGSMDWMNETLMSRDLNKGQSPHDVPPLDISLDNDNLKW